MAQALEEQAAMSDARTAILQTLASRKGNAKAIPDYQLPAFDSDAAAHFIARAKASVAQVHEIPNLQDAPALIWSILARSNAPRRLHIPAVSPLSELPWRETPGLEISSQPPSGEDSALSFVDYGIAETGTLAFSSGTRSASSWHFRPGREFALLSRASIVPRLEDVIRLVRVEQSMPATLNLVTGPSRTADIEQTIELGAHGPRELHIVIAG